MSSRVTIKQFTREEDGSFVAPFTPEHAIYDTNGKRLDVKIAGLDLDRISSALTHSEEAISAQTAESLQKIIYEQAEDRKRLDALDQGQISDNERITYLEKQTIPLALSYTSITPKAGTSERGTTFVVAIYNSEDLKASGQVQIQILKNRYGETMLEPQLTNIKPEYYVVGNGYNKTPQQVESVFDTNGNFTNPFEVTEEINLDSLLGGM